jgi:hypothetical protein
MNKTLLAVILSLIAGFAGFLARNRAATDLPMALI